MCTLCTDQFASVWISSFVGFFGFGRYGIFSINSLRYLCSPYAGHKNAKQNSPTNPNISASFPRQINVHLSRAPLWGLSERNLVAKRRARFYPS